MDEQRAPLLSKLDALLKPAPTPLPLLLLVTPGVILMLMSVRLMEVRGGLPFGFEVPVLGFAAFLTYQWIGYAGRGLKVWLGRRRSTPIR